EQPAEESAEEAAASERERAVAQLLAPQGGGRCWCGVPRELCGRPRPPPLLEAMVGEAGPVFGQLYGGEPAESSRRGRYVVMSLLLQQLADGFFVKHHFGAALRCLRAYMELCEARLLSMESDRKHTHTEDPAREVRALLLLHDLALQPERAGGRGPAGARGLLQDLLRRYGRPGQLAGLRLALEASAMALERDLEEDQPVEHPRADAVLKEFGSQEFEDSHHLLYAGQEPGRAQPVEDFRSTVRLALELHVTSGTPPTAEEAMQMVLQGWVCKAPWEAAQYLAQLADTFGPAAT
ncbi:unnamed protein product, partial [Prorocentrum cordatum]